MSINTCNNVLRDVCGLHYVFLPFNVYYVLKRAM